jgi:putative oxidoreductase
MSPIRPPDRLLTEGGRAGHRSINDRARGTAAAPAAKGKRMNALHAALDRLDALATRCLARSGITLRPSIVLLRLSLGLVFLGFGLLKFFPGLSPAERLAEDTIEKLTLGLIPGGLGLVLVALLESAIGLCLLTGRYLRLGLALLGVAMVGVLSPLVLFPDELFSRRYNAPTLEGQYVLKDVILLAAGLVVAAGARGRHAAPGAGAGGASSGDRRAVGGPPGQAPRVAASHEAGRRGRMTPQPR